MPNIGLPEILIVLAIALIVFGPKRLPEMGRSLGKGIREFKNSVTGSDEEEEEPREIERGQVHESTRPLEGEVVQDRKS
jgi:sec-independent protein translocase protein TatA